MKAGRALYAGVGALCLSAPWTAGCLDDAAWHAPFAQPPGQEPPGQPPSGPAHPLFPGLNVPGSTQRTPPGVRPPPISGGTLLVQKDGVTAVAADPDRDVVWVVNLAAQKLATPVWLEHDDEPGRVVEDAAGRVHVALRRGGALVTIDPTTSTILARRPVCPAPRGLAYDASLDAVHVACADGLLATFPAAGGAAIRAVQVDSDLRDVIVQGGVLYVSRFRAAELLQLAADGTIAQRTSMPAAVDTMNPMSTLSEVPGVAYRTVALPGGGLAMLHQRSQLEAVDTSQGGYSGGGMCPGVGIVQDTVSFIQPGTAPGVGLPLMMVTLAVDMAVSSDGTQIAIAAPGNQFGPAVGTYPTALLQQVAPVGGPAPCGPPPGGGPGGAGQGVIAVAFDGQGRVVAQTREPPSISVADVVISLPGTSMANDGHANFHTGTKAGIACASCHPEGGDDGRVWQFTGLGPRRTQNLRGGVLSRMPFHWSGDIANMDELVTVVLMGRMDGPGLTEQQTVDLGQWMDAQPALAAPPPADPASVARGAMVFHDATVGCTACHSGPQLSTHALVDVGTGGTFKVPSLVAVGYRAPYLHDGCAATLLDRFSVNCNGNGTHGHTSQLDAGQLGDLVAYLQSL